MARSPIVCLETPGNSPGAHDVSAQTDSRPSGVQRRRHARRRQDAHLVRYRMGLWLRGGHSKPFEARSSGWPKLTAPCSCPRTGQPSESLKASSRRMRISSATSRSYTCAATMPKAGPSLTRTRFPHPTVVSNIWQVSPHLVQVQAAEFLAELFAHPGRQRSRAARPTAGCSMSSSSTPRWMACESTSDSRPSTRSLFRTCTATISSRHRTCARMGRPDLGARKLVDKMEHPERFDYAAPIQAYRKKNPDGSPMTGVRVDRALKPGEAVRVGRLHFPGRLDARPDGVRALSARPNRWAGRLPLPATTFSATRTTRPRPATRQWSPTTARSSKKATSTARNI